MEYAAILLIGLAAGLAGGMLGIGGSIVMIPALTEFIGPDQHLYQAAAMIVNFFIVVPAVYQHTRHRAIDVQTVIRLVPWCLLGVAAGVGISELSIFAGPREAYLRMLFGLFLLIIGIQDLYMLWRTRAHPGEPPAEGTAARGALWQRGAAVALPTGLVAGLLGVGGGTIAVPLLRRILHAPMRQAVANSAAIIVVTSFVGSILKNAAYMRENGYTLDTVQLAGLLIPTAMFGSLFGARLTHVVPVRALRGVFCIVLMLAATRMISGAWQDLHG